MFNVLFKSFSLDSVHAPLTPVAFESLSGDGRRNKVKVLDVKVPSPVKRKQRMEDWQQESTYANILESALSNFGPDGFVMVPDSCLLDNVDGLIAAAASRTRRCYTTSDQPLLEWRAFADKYLAEFMRNEG
ncbi:hypothetical protein BT96DRAFT_996002 [Gymnopus androsaceus JB14]|uniref:Uncharacterized protein n=1 Tax=Gymnopus androsaceus JB14 TaxID=1447944 RepID=A0A6A4HJW2_9AGAR|nr:hypothetical protein BT96DRAFT_996002 [Gymnopus androsaceus JB14]